MKTENQPLKILYIFNGRYPTEKAHGFQISKMCEAFSNLNHQVMLLIPNLKNTKELTKVESVFRYYSIKKTFEIKKLGCLDLSFLKRIKKSPIWFLTYSISFSIRVFFWLFRRREKFDVIYSRDPFSMYLVSFIRKNLRTVFEAHSFPKARTSLKVKSAKKTDYLVVVTHRLKDMFVNSGISAGKILVEPNAIDIEHFDLKISKITARKKLKLREKTVMVSYVGQFHTMEMEKGIPEVIRSARLLLEQFPDLVCYFIGGPLDREAKYRDLIERIHLPQGKFFFLQKQPVSDVPIWLKASDILIMPFPRTLHFSFFMSPLKMFEYMASRRPIVGSKLPAIEEILKDGKNALLAEPENPNGIAEQIGKLLMRPALGKTLAQQAFNDVQIFTWKKRAERILSFISCISN